jgi:erythromycin esterase
MDWDKLRDLYFRKFVAVPCHGCPEPDYKLSVDEQYELMRMIDAISNYTQYIMFSKGTTMNLKVIMQWIRNLNTAFSFVEYVRFTDSADSGVRFTVRNRDYQMAENMTWIMKNFSEERFIVWTANFHGAKDISQTRYPADSLTYFNLQCMGESVYAEYGDKMYSLAFTSLEDEEKRGNLEREIANITENAPFAFIDFEPLRFVDGYRDQEFESSVIMKKQGKWLYIFDGIYYIRDQKHEE